MIENIINKYEQLDNMFSNELYEAMQDFKKNPTRETRDNLICVHRKFKSIDVGFESALRNLFIGKKIK